MTLNLFPIEDPRQTAYRLRRKLWTEPQIAANEVFFKAHETQAALPPAAAMLDENGVSWWSQDTPQPITDQ